MKSQRRQPASRLPAVLVALALMALSVTIAAAHTTTIVKADPAVGSTVAKSPPQVMVQFSEEVVSKGSTMKVVDASGKQVSQGDGHLDLNDPNHQTMLASLLSSPLPDGVFTVKYHVILTDGDATDDSYKFTVKSADSAVVQQATATAAPPPAPATTPTAAATVAATQAVTATAATTAMSSAVVTATLPAAATVQPAAARTPAALPTTGGSGGVGFSWPLAALGVILIALGLTARLRRSAR
jgi:methionine-rich copper-binding protein CopC